MKAFLKLKHWQLFLLTFGMLFILFADSGIPPQADCGWIGEAGPGPSYGDTECEGEKISPPMGFDSGFTNKNTTFMTYNLLHLASLLKSNGGYSAYGNSSEDWKTGSRWEFKKPRGIT